MTKSKVHSLKEIDNLKQKWNKLVEEQGKPALMLAVNDLFAGHEKIEALRWTQSTPSFNDGDPCVFSMNELMVKLVDKSKSEDTSVDASPNEDKDEEDTDFNDEDGEDDEDFVELYYLKEREPKIHKDISKFWNFFPNEMALAIFGDGKQITITRDGITEEDYDCGY